MKLKKLMAMLLGIMLVISAAAVLAEPAEKNNLEDTGAAASEGGGVEYTYLAFTWNYEDYDIPEALNGMGDKSRMIQMLMPGASVPAALLLPDDCGAPEDYAYKSIMITVNTPISIERSGRYIKVNDLPKFITPKQVEIVGDVS